MKDSKVTSFVYKVGPTIELSDLSLEVSSFRGLDLECSILRLDGHLLTAL